jgi:hypothetical protein
LRSASKQQKSHSLGIRCFLRQHDKQSLGVSKGVVAQSLSCFIPEHDKQSFFVQAAPFMQAISFVHAGLEASNQLFHSSV